MLVGECGATAGDDLVMVPDSVRLALPWRFPFMTWELSSICCGNDVAEVFVSVTETHPNLGTSDPVVSVTIELSIVQKGADIMSTITEFGGAFMSDTQLWEIFSVLDPAAEALGGYARVFEDGQCFRCGGGDERSGMSVQIPPERGALFPDERNLPLVFVNIRLCGECIRWVAAVPAHEAELVEKVLGAIVA